MVWVFMSKDPSPKKLGKVEITLKVISTRVHPDECSLPAIFRFNLSDIIFTNNHRINFKNLCFLNILGRFS